MNDNNAVHNMALHSGPILKPFILLIYIRNLRLLVLTIFLGVLSACSNADEPAAIDINSTGVSAANKTTPTVTKAIRTVVGKSKRVPTKMLHI